MQTAIVRALWDRFEFVHTPKHGSWLNMADIETVRREVAAWQAHRDQLQAKINWQFTTDSARIKLKRRYPTLEP